MSPEEMLAKIAEIAEALRSDVASHVEKMDARYDALEKKLDAKKKDEEGDDDTIAEKTAADSVRVRVLEDQVKNLQQRMPTRTPSDRDALADLQAKADVAYRALGERADMPMLGEGTVEYAIRLHRGLQKHSKKFKTAELAVAARDPSTFAAICDAIRADAFEVGISPVGMPEFSRREIKTESPGGHRITTFVGNGTIFKQLSRPVRHVKWIGANDKMPRSAGGSIYAPGMSRQ